jgi:hypothetical protein
MASTTKQPFSCKVTTITPAMAKVWLDNSSFSNRHLENTRVQKLASDIKKGKWIFDGTPIRFNGGGDILDGQHRLHAIIRANLPVESLVIKGIKSESKNTIDTGKPRSIGDVLHFHGHLNTTTLAAAARLSIAFNEYKGDLNEWSKSSRTAAVTNQEIIEEATSNEKLVNAVQHAISLKYTRQLMGAGVAAFTYYLLSKAASPHIADNFFQAIEHGNNLNSDSPILLLRNTFALRDSKNNLSGQRRSTYNIALIIKAWNAWRSKEVIRVLKYGRDEEYPKAIK